MKTGAISALHLSIWNENTASAVTRIPAANIAKENQKSLAKNPREDLAGRRPGKPRGR